MIAGALLVAAKDLRLLARDPGACFWALGFPLLFAVLLGAVYQAAMGRGPSRVPVAFVDEAATESSRALALALSKDDAFELRPRTALEASQDVSRGEAAAYIVIPRGFGEGAESGLVVLGVDPSRRAESAFLQAKLAAGVGAFARSADQAPPFRYLEVAPEGGGARSAAELVFPAAILWGLIGCAGSFAVAIVAERSSGTFVRLLASPVGAGSLVAGKALACFATCLLDVCALAVIARLFGHVRMESTAALVLAVVSLAFCFSGLTVLLGTLGRSEQAVGSAAWGLLLLLAMVGGAMVPVALMPSWMSALAEGSPVRWGIVALESATFRARPASAIVGPCARLLLTGVMALLLGYRLARRST